MLHLVETLRELRVCEGAGNARKTRGNGTCLSLEPCCLNPALCRWPLLLCLLLCQLLLCISAPKRQKEETKITCKCTCAHLSLVCFWQFGSFTYRTRQKDVPNLSYHESRHQSLPGEGLPPGGHMDKTQCARSHLAVCSPLTSQQTPGLTTRQPPLPGSLCDVLTDSQLLFD